MFWLKVEATPHVGEEKESEEEELNKPSGSNGPITDSEPTAPGGDSTTDPEENLNRSGDWPVERLCHSHERAIPIQETVESLDITEEGGGRTETHTPSGSITYI